MNEKKLRHISDDALLQQYYTSGDNYWLGVLLQRYTLLVLGVAMKYLKNEEEAQDCAQQVFLKVLRYLPEHKVTYFKSWLYMVTKNECLIHIRNHNYNRENELTEEIQDNYVSVENAADKEEILQYMETSLTDLPDEQRRCVQLFYLKKMSYNEVAAHTGFTLPQVKSYIQNGKRNLKNIVERKLREQHG